MIDENCVEKEATPIGKFDWLQGMMKRFKKHHANACAKGDDVAIISYENKKNLVATKLFLDGIHFDLTYFPLKHLGYKFVSVTMTQMLSMNVLPTHLIVQIGVSNRFSFQQVEEVMEGVRFCCHQYQIDLAQLDVVSSNQGLVASITLLSHVDKNLVIDEKGAKENDLICVTGDLGAAYAGLLLLEREKKVFEVNPTAQPDFSGYDYLIEKQLKPEPRVEIIKTLQKKQIIPTSMISVNNGLAAAIIHICRNSLTGCRIIEPKLPIDLLTFQTLKDFNIVPTTVALNGGDDNELIFTIQQSDFEKVKNIEEVAIVGYIKNESAGYYLITNDDKQIALTAQEFSPLIF